MSCEFSIPTTLSAADIIAKASVAIQNDGGDFTATENGGVFVVPTPVGSIDGNFEIISGSIDVTVTRKPFFVSCAKIESQLTEYVNGGLLPNK